MSTKLAVILLLFALRLAAAPFVTILPNAYPANVLQGTAAKTVSGELIYGGDGSAPLPAWAGKIVLLDRGNIDFAGKMNAVKIAGGVGCIVANNVPGIFAGALAAGSSSTLPGVTVSKEDGATLRGGIGKIATIGDAVSPPPPGSFPDPAGHAGEVIVSDGKVAQYAKLLPIGMAAAATYKPGTNLLFAAVADGGSPSPEYQWFKDGTAIAGETGSTLAITGATPTNSGSYTCVASNSAGSATSGPFNLTIQ